MENEVWRNGGFDEGCGDAICGVAVSDMYGDLVIRRLQSVRN